MNSFRATTLPTLPCTLLFSYLLPPSPAVRPVKHPLQCQAKVGVKGTACTWPTQAVPFKLIKVEISTLISSTSALGRVKSAYRCIVS